jgi:monofunctional biosynthetic peptidoglycan transglycosylase
VRRKRKIRLSTAVLLALIMLCFYLGYYFIYPDIARLRKVNPKKTAYMEQCEKKWREKGLENKKIIQFWVPYSRVSPYLVKAVLIAEDDKFWHHDGFDFEGMEKAMEKDIKARKFKAGGSTITQQLAKNLFLSNSKNPVRKLKEAILAWRMEKTLSKRRILEIYLNVAQWGDEIFGAEAAARHYFGKSASSLTAEEAARLATVLPNPERLSPVGGSNYVARRSAFIYRIMVKRGIVSKEMEDEVKEISNSQEAGVENTPAATVNSPSAPLGTGAPAAAAGPENLQPAN